MRLYIDNGINVVKRSERMFPQKGDAYQRKTIDRKW